MLPHALPPWGTVHGYYQRFRLDGTWIRIHDSIRSRVRKEAGRKVTPSAGIMNSPSVKTTKRGDLRAATTGKHVSGSKRHILVDTTGCCI